MKKWIVLLIVGLLLTGCKKPVREQTFTKDGFAITLTNRFKEYDVQNWDYYLEDNEISFMEKRLDKGESIPYNEDSLAFLSKLFKTEILPETLPENMPFAIFTLSQYIDYVLDSYHLESEVYSVHRPAKNKIMYYFYYSTDIGDVNYLYMYCVMEDAGYFYNINFCCESDAFDRLEPTLFKYATSIALGDK